MLNRKIKILLIAYACEPNKGSEPGVGWNWVIHLSKYIDVTVITRYNNKNIIENELKNKKYSNIKFIYYDIPIINKLKNYIPYGIKIYSIFWEYFLFNKIKDINVDLIQRITFVSTICFIRLYKLKTPYIMSFCGGGEISPIEIYKQYNIINKIKEKVRYIYNSAYKYCSIVRNNYKKSKICIAVTNETKNFLIKLGIKKNIIVMPAIGINRIKKNYNKKRKNKIIYAGSLIYWKNVDIIIKAFINASKNNNNIKLSIFGNGGYENRLKKILNYSLLNKSIKFNPSISQNKLFNILEEFDLALHSSSHDSGSMFILEVLNYGIPVIFLDTGGPKEIFNGINYPLKINPYQSYENIIKSFSKKIEWFYENYDLFMKEFSKYRDEVINKYEWENKSKNIMNIYNDILNNNI